MQVVTWNDYEQGTATESGVVLIAVAQMIRGAVVGKFKPAALEFVFERIVSHLGKRFGAAGKLLQLAIGHGSIVGGQTPSFALFFEKRVSGIPHRARILRLRLAGKGWCDMGVEAVM